MKIVKIIFGVFQVGKNFIEFRKIIIILRSNRSPNSSNYILHLLAIIKFRTNFN